jgi:hypothetical protein
MPEERRRWRSSNRVAIVHVRSQERVLVATTENWGAMNELQAVAVRSQYLEHLLKRHGLLDERGEVKVDDSGGLPAELQCRLAGLIETTAELRRLVKIAGNAHQGEPIFPSGRQCCAIGRRNLPSIGGE